MRFPLGVIVLHWLTAALMAATAGVGLWAANASGLDRLTAFQLHKSLGLTLLLIVAVRLINRMAGGRRPPHAGWRGRLAGAAQTGLYVLMVAAPITGWAAASASPLPFPVAFWKWEAPRLPLDVGQAAYDRAADLHLGVLIALAILLSLHLAGALAARLSGGPGALFPMGLGRAPGRKP
ncbi:cytochrome b/b6 domain-containing protein [Brevundimonas sp. 2R-24]|uniref:Cytochrome b/b6 domain-containing protein n=1 Tax=Peiella sedimenti TaxID=3061083 RepID=A0ABT8SLL8_9CAUL|nr:cytochrome b/b6 domain-containing protein [Caulobacteraceae bacterium XZ-24]